MIHNPKLLGENIRKYRKLLHLTQSELADKLYITAQNISKWELGQSMPDIANLCALSEILGISIDRLLGQSEARNERMMIAIDGGGTKTEFLLFSESGQIIDRQLREGSNPNSCGMEASLAAIESGVNALIARTPSVAAIYGGVAGCGSAENRSAFLHFLKKKYPDVKIDVKSDILNVVYSTDCFERCIAVIVGTGSVVYAKSGEKLERFGGWGYRFDRSCSGYDFGRDAIAAALAEEDGIGPKTLITPMIEDAVGGRAKDKFDVLYAMKNEKIASLADTVFKAYKMGDSVAREILSHNVGQLVHLIKCAATAEDCGNQVVISGGLTARRDILLEFLHEKGAFFDFVFPTLPQIYGACAYCNRMFGEPRAEFAANFEKNYLKMKGQQSNA